MEVGIRWMKHKPAKNYHICPSLSEDRVDSDMLAFTGEGVRRYTRLIMTHGSRCPRTCVVGRLSENALLMYTHYVAMVEG